MIGNVIDKYEILQKVGEGGMAVVYRGRHVTLGRDVAVKVLHPHLSSSSRNRKRFAREARAIEQLQHANILRIHDYSGADSEQSWIVTEFIDGATLSEFIKERRRLPSEAVAIIGMRLSAALRYAHEQGIIHRDIKPENIMIRRDGVLKLTDFGIARFLEEGQMTMTGALVGSPAYMSPEQAMEHRLDQRSDLFSLGTVLFHAVSGELPFTGSNPSVILRNIIEGNRPDVGEVAPDASPALSDVIERLLQTDAGNRYQSAEEVATALVQVIEGVGISADEPAWSLRRLITEPEAYRQDLEEHLCGTLLERGRTYLDSNEHLKALRSFNRLLALDPDNEEVLALVQSLHAGPRSSPGRKVSFASIALLVALAGLGVYWLAVPDEPVGAPRDPQPEIRAQDPDPLDSVEARPLGGNPDDLTPGASESVTAPESLTALAQGAAQSKQSDSEGADASHGSTGSGPGVGSAGPGGVRMPGEPAVVAPIQSPDRMPGSATAQAVPGEQGSLRVTIDQSGPGWAEIYLDGEHLGRTGSREPFEVAPGKHHLVLRNPFCKDWEQDITVDPGELEVLSDVNMIDKPATVNIAQSVADACAVWLDGAPLGNTAQMGRQFSLPEPRSPHQVQFHCPDAEPLDVPIEGATPGATLVVPGLP